MPHKKLKSELYDLASDPRESQNVIADHADVAKSLTKEITNIVQNGRTTPGVAQSNDTGHWSDLTWINHE